MSEIQDSSHSSDNKIQQFYYKRIYIEKGYAHRLILLSYSWHGKVQQTKEEQEQIQILLYDQIS